MQTLIDMEEKVEELIKIVRLLRKHPNNTGTLNESQIFSIAVKLQSAQHMEDLLMEAFYSKNGESITDILDSSLLSIAVWCENNPDLHLQEED